jgi:REP element-mobilizing transposase RayT
MPVAVYIDKGTVLFVLTGTSANSIIISKLQPFIRKIIMPRQERKTSDTNIYHVLLRGINQQRIFEEAEDYIQFLDCIYDVKQQSGFTLYAYCLMGNHVHLLLKEGIEPLAMIFRRLGVRYVHWFNKKYERSGHLFQDRFRSEPVEAGDYFLTVLIYIYQNPVKAGLCPSPEDYEWGSRRFLGRDGSVVDNAALSAIAPIDVIKKKESDKIEEGIFGPMRGRRPVYNDKEAVVIMRQLCGAANSSGFQKIPVKEQQRAVAEMRESRVPIRQIVRVTGMSKGIVEKWGKIEA